MQYTSNSKPRKTLKKRSLILAGAIIVVVLICGVALAVRSHNSDSDKATATSHPGSNSVDYSPAKPSETSDNEDRKNSTSPSTTLSNNPNSTAENSSLDAQIVSANNRNGNVHIGTSVSGATTGTCKLTASQGAQNLTLGTSSVQQDVNAYGCGVFNIATSSFPTPGSWKLTLTVTSNGATATNSTTVNI